MMSRFSFRFLIFLGAISLCACHTTRHVVANSSETHDVQLGHREQAATQRFDSLISKLSVSADSVTVLLYGDSCLCPAKTGSPAARITIHSPRISREDRSGSDTFTQTHMADSTRSHVERSASTDTSEEVIGGADPPNLTWVFIVVGLGITLLLIGAVFGYVWLHKKGII